MKKIRHACAVAVVGAAMTVFGTIAMTAPAQACSPDDIATAMNQAATAVANQVAANKSGHY